MRELRTEIEIDAPPERVWQVLTDFAAYPDWNPLIRSIEGEPQVGLRLKVRIEPSGARGMTFGPTVRAAEPARELRWLGRLFVRGSSTASTGLRSSHSRTGVRGSSRVSASAGCSSAYSRGRSPRPSGGFEQMNEALKRRAEER